MPYALLRAYLEQLPALHAEDQLDAIQAATLPHAKRSVAKEHIRDLRKTVRRGQPRRRPVKASARDLAALGIAVREV